MKKLILSLSLFILSAVVFAQHSLGEWYGGGTIFYLYDNGKHGLIAAREDQGNVKWFTGGSPERTGAIRNGIGSISNTVNIIAKQSFGDHAAMVCAKYKEGGFGDWYLPSKDELNLMYQNKNVIINLKNWYWSSTESGWNEAWLQSMTTGEQFSSPKSNARFVRAIRAF